MPAQLANDSVGPARLLGLGVSVGGSPVATQPDLSRSPVSAFAGALFPPTARMRYATPVRIASPATQAFQCMWSQ